VDFSDHAPALFAEVRGLSGLRTSEYVSALGSHKRERFTEGASGAFLYFSGDGSLIVKTMTSSDREALLRLLPAYVAHLRAHPGSALVRFFGCHTVHAFGRDIHLVVMGNALRQPPAAGPAVEERYDLKGSWVGRRAVLPRPGESATCKHCGRRFVVTRRHVAPWRPRQQRGPGPATGTESDSAAAVCPARGGGGGWAHEASVLLKDEDWGWGSLGLSAGDARALRRELTADVGFLRSQGVMDYSLLLGVRSRPLPAGEGRGEGLCAAEVWGRETFALGIVDVLQGWDASKAAERMAKTWGRCKDRFGISAVPPGPYAERFLDRVVEPLTRPATGKH